jgi:hypothetical protein
MATYKNISDDWYISLDGGLGTIYIDGNLDVTGNITYVSEIAVNDAFIIVAANNVGSVNDMGLIATVNANTGTYAGLRFDTAANAWQISSSVYANGAPITAYANLAAGGTGIPGGNINDIQINNGSGGFTASNNFEFDIANSKLTLTGHEVLSNIGTAPTATANSVTIYNNAPGAGSTGLYVVGNTVPADEVISLTRARLYSIIF